MKKDEDGLFAEDAVPITPVNFFQISADCHYLPYTKKDVFPVLKERIADKYLLPDTTKYCSEDNFADVSMGWNEEGLELFINVHARFKTAHYPSIELGDSIELFVDTRDVKTAGFNTRFCHHFYFLAEAVEGSYAGEITRFRTEDTHPLCDANELKVKSLVRSSGYVINIFIPSHCLYGYDPAQFNRLGFSYRVNRSEGYPQHFSVVTDDFAVDQQPSLWASLKLIR